MALYAELLHLTSPKPVNTSICTESMALTVNIQETRSQVVNFCSNLLYQIVSK
jgi:hypothetical protein